jgi:hypothetical protein
VKIFSRGSLIGPATPRRHDATTLQLGKSCQLAFDGSHNWAMEELTKLLTKIELTADDIINAKQQIVHLDAKRHKSREALNRLREQYKNNPRSVKKNWVCLGDMFIRLDYNTARNSITDDQYQLDQGIEKLRDELKEKVNQLRQLEGKPELVGFSLKPLKKEEILALRTGFKI